MAEVAVINGVEFGLLISVTEIGNAGGITNINSNRKRKSRARKEGNWGSQHWIFSGFLATR